MKKYLFKPYNKKFPELFRGEKERISPQVKGITRIEHVGSTAVPGLGGKGIIDIAVVAPEEAMPSISKQLQDLGYEFRPKWSTPQRFYFVIDLLDPEEGTRRYHLHLMPPESRELEEMIAFRDYLMTHPDELEIYAELKRQAAMETANDGAKYRALKEPLIQRVLKKLREE